jgi:hypothetical protein
MHQTLDPSYQNRITDALLQDFHTAHVVTIMFEMQKTLNKTQDSKEKSSILNTFEWLLPIVGLHIDLNVSNDIETYLTWQEARNSKNIVKQTSTETNLWKKAIFNNFHF